MTIITGIIYFFFLPLVYVLSGEETFFDLDMKGLPSAQIAMALYMIGAVTAFTFGREVLRRHPLAPLRVERLLNSHIYLAVLAILALAIVAKFISGSLKFGAQVVADVSYEASGLNFLNLAFSSLISMTIYTLIQKKFSPAALLLFTMVLALFLLDGFRFRIVILCSAAALSWFGYKGIRPRQVVVGLGIMVGFIISNFIGMTRNYGQGIDLSAAEGSSFKDIAQAVGGEIGPVFTLSHLTQRGSDFLLFEPWVLAISRFIPSAIWPNKPYPEYLLKYPEGFPDPAAMFGGIAGTQHAEFYMQFGWIGLPIVAFGFFMLVVWTIKQLLMLSPSARLAGVSIMPGLVGFYCQQRGYAFQLLCEYIFTLAPLFLIHIGRKRYVHTSTKRYGLPKAGTHAQSLRANSE